MTALILSMLACNDYSLKNNTETNVGSDGQPELQSDPDQFDLGRVCVVESTGELSQDLGRLERVEMRLFNTGDSYLEISEMVIVDIQGLEVPPLDSGFFQTQIHPDWQ